MKPASFCTIATKSCAYELIGLLLSLSIFHPNVPIYIMCDEETKTIIKELVPQPKLKIKIIVELDKYSTLNRAQMEARGIFGDFLKNKAKIMLHALKKEKDVLFLDSDIILINKIEDIDKKAKLGVSPQYICKKSLAETGYFNAGMLWTNSPYVCEDWIKFTDSSRYFEQAAIEDLVTKYGTFKFGEEYNVQCWRYYFNYENNKLEYNFSINNENTIMYKNKPLRCIHTHFLDGRHKNFNYLIINLLNFTKNYKILLIIYRVINNSWVIKIPENQHTDSFRELAVLIGEKNKNVTLLKTNEKHCWLSPNILLYDRPTLEWCDQNVKNASLFLLSNGNVVNEEKNIKKYGNMKVLPWIFWPRRPRLLEQFLRQNEIPDYVNRSVGCIFIGNIENTTQDKYRSPFIKQWTEAVDIFECTYGRHHKYTAIQYLQKIMTSRFGLCVRGYGEKCHREIELMAVGTVPIVTKNVNTSSYLEPLIEKTHYFKADSPAELKNIVNTTPKHKWLEMSKACHYWYMRNIHSDNAWNTMIKNILYS